MIQTIEGRIGGGKTYTAMGWILNHLAKGGVVATNINVQIEKFKDQYGEKRGIRSILKIYFNYILKDNQIIFLSDTKTIKIQTKKGMIDLNEIVTFYKLVPRGTPDQPVLVVIDEAHIHFPQDGYRGIPKEVLHFLTLSRHACVDVVFISQHIKNMWCQMLRLAQFRWAVRDMKKYGAQVGMFSIPWPFPHILQNKNDYDGSTVISRKFEWVRKHLFETYKSPELASAFESMPVAASVKVEKKKVTMKERGLLFGSGVAIGLAVVIIPGCFSSKKEDPPKSISPTEEKDVRSNSDTSKDFVEEPSEEREIYKGFSVLGKYSGSLFTDQHTYRIGDLYDGLPIVQVGDRWLKLYIQSSKAYRTVRFD